MGYVRRAAQDLLELVNDLLDLAKVEAGKVEVKPVEFEAAKSVRGLARHASPVAPQSIGRSHLRATWITFRECTPTRGKSRRSSAISFPTALKFTERGEIRVSASLDRTVTICFSVADTGIGIAPKDLDLIFQDFGQVDHPIQKRVRGTGLGLPLSKKLAALLGGRVLVESELGTGSVFTLQIPLPLSRRPGARRGPGRVGSGPRQPSRAGGRRQSGNDDDVQQLSEGLRISGDARRHDSRGRGYSGSGSARTQL